MYSLPGSKHVDIKTLINVNLNQVMAQTITVKCTRKKFVNQSKKNLLRVYVKNTGYWVTNGSDDRGIAL